MKILAPLLLSICIFSCVSDTPQECANVYFTNKTDYNLKIEGFLNKKLLRSYTIEPQKRLVTTVNIKYSNIFGYGGNEDFIDSINIKFNDERIIVQYCNGKGLGFCPDIVNNFQLKYEKEKYVGTFKSNAFNRQDCIVRKEPLEVNIDQSDYDRAVPIKK